MTLKQRSKFSQDEMKMAFIFFLNGAGKTDQKMTYQILAQEKKNDHWAKGLWGYPKEKSRDERPD